MVINTRDLLVRAARFQSESLSVYLYDMTKNIIDKEVSPEFLSGIEILVSEDYQGKEQVNISSFPETEYAMLRDADHYFEEELKIGGRTWMIVVVPVEGVYEANLTLIILSGCLIFFATALLSVWMIHNMRRSIQMHRIITKAAAEAAIVSSLFPADVRDRMIEDQAAGLLRSTMTNGKLDSQLTSEGIFGSKCIAELYPYTTVM